MSRADDLQAAHHRVLVDDRVAVEPTGAAFDLNALHAAIPDLLAVVRAAQDVRGNDPSVGTLRRALAAFEAGGKERE